MRAYIALKENEREEKKLSCPIERPERKEAKLRQGFPPVFKGKEGHIVF